LKQLKEALADPEWEQEATRNQQEIGRLWAKMGKLLARFGDDPDLEEALAEQIQSIREQITTREGLAASLAAKIAATGRAEEQVQQVASLLWDWPKSWLDGELGPLHFQQLSNEDKKLVAQTVGLRVEVGKPAGGKQGELEIGVKVFDYKHLRQAFGGSLPSDTFSG
jgi:hypothetical protein